MMPHCRPELRKTIDYRPSDSIVPHSIELILSASFLVLLGDRARVLRAGCKRGALNAGQAWLETITVRFFGLLQGRVAVVSVVKHIRHYLVSEPGGDKSSF